jgi:hypothetical protein
MDGWMDGIDDDAGFDTPVMKYIQNIRLLSFPFTPSFTLSYLLSVQ